MKAIKYIFICMILFTSCEQIIELDLNENTSQIVIEGNITDQSGPYFVKITKSTPISEQNNPPTIDNAEVTISDDQGYSEMLEFIGNGVYQTKKLQGVSGRTYSLTVKAESKIYTAQSKMPVLVVLDSLKIVTSSFGGEIDYDFIPVYTDLASIGDHYRFILSINGKQMKSHFVLNDNIENGSVNSQHLQNIMELALIPGDEVTVQMQKIDTNVGLYYATLVQNTDTGPGGGATPSNPPNNISNGALGIFSAHTVQQRSAVIK